MNNRTNKIDRMKEQRNKQAKKRTNKQTNKQLDRTNRLSKRKECSPEASSLHQRAHMYTCIHISRFIHIRLNVCHDVFGYCGTA